MVVWDDVKTLLSSPLFLQGLFFIYLIIPNHKCFKVVFTAIRDTIQVCLFNNRTAPMLVILCLLGFSLKKRRCRKQETHTIHVQVPSRLVFCVVWSSNSRLNVCECGLALLSALSCGVPGTSALTPRLGPVSLPAVEGVGCLHGAGRHGQGPPDLSARGGGAPEPGRTRPPLAAVDGRHGSAVHHEPGDARRSLSATNICVHIQDV